MPKENVVDYETVEVEEEVTLCERCGDEDTPYKAFSNLRPAEDDGNLSDLHRRGNVVQLTADGVAWFCEECHEKLFHDPAGERLY